jgi:hypothetical protein
MFRAPLAARLVKLLQVSIELHACARRMIVFLERASGAVVARPTPLRKVRGSSPVRDKDFSSSYETPEILGAGDSHVLRMRR